MKLVDFTNNHIEEALHLIKLNYGEARAITPFLPVIDTFPDLSEFAHNNLGIAAMKQGKMVGFLCCSHPREPHFGLTKGVFSPLHGHGSLKENRQDIYDALYQAASKKWVSHAILSHAISLYAHDEAALDIFFTNGFGKRTSDAICLTKIQDISLETFTIKQLQSSEVHQVLPLSNALASHLSRAPMFIPTDLVTEFELLKDMQKTTTIYLGVYDDCELVAYISLNQNDGETFISDDPSVFNINSAYALPEYRGQGLYQALLGSTFNWLKKNGYPLCGVDFETFNGTARHFWLKHFTPYTYGLTRRIDERIINETHPVK